MLRGLIYMLTIMGGLALAQLGYPPQELAQALGGRMVGPNIWVGAGQLRYQERSGLLYQLRYAGPARETLVLARIVANAVGNRALLGEVVGFLDENLAGFRNKGPQTLSLGPGHEMVLEYRNFQVTAQIGFRQVTNFGQDTHLAGRSGPIIRIYSDFECPYCKRLAEQVIPQLRSRYQEPGLARISYRHLPLTSIHDRALPLAVASECAAEQGQFEAFHDRIFASLDAVLVARQLSLDLGRFAQCNRDNRVKARVNRQLEGAIALGLEATPTVFVGPFLLPNPFDLASYQRYLNLASAQP